MMEEKSSFIITVKNIKSRNEDPCAGPIQTKPNHFEARQTMDKLTTFLDRETHIMERSALCVSLTLMQF